MLRSLYIALAVSAVFAGVPPPEESKRLVDRLSESEHFKNEHHNKQFDHDAFLGEDQSKTFDQLPPEESKRRLGLIVDRIDSDKNGLVSLVELKDWIKYTQKRYITEDVDRHWRQHNPSNNDAITWDTYRKNVYGFMDDLDDKEIKMPNSEGFSYNALLKRDRRRWTYADADENDALNHTEFAAFLHPEDHSEMRDVVVLETLEDIDKNKQYDPYRVHYDQAVIRPKPLREHEKPQDLRNVPGTPGVDFPIYHAVPETGFSCHHVPVRPGMYANVETGCQAYHVCHDGREGEQGASFLCTNGTLFDQAKFACDWWYNVDCSQAVSLYRLNADPEHNPFIPKPKPEEEAPHGVYYRKI